MAQKESFEIRLDDLRFYARIGVMEQERIVGNEFRVDIRVALDAAPFLPEKIESTVSYAEIYDLAAEVVSRPHLLLESVAMEIADSIALHFVQISDIAVKITKLAVPVKGMTGTASVEYRREKNI